MTAPYRTPISGELLANRYELGEHIDSGGMAEVWEAKDHTLGRTVAVKILHGHLARDAAFLRRFQREAVNAARLQHPTIVAIYDAVSYDGLEAIVMERIEGRTLRSVLDEHNKLPARDVVDMGQQIAQALSVAHEAGVVHRDIKPSNIMLCEDRRIRVTDFGIAKAGEDTDLTRTGTLLGTAKYLAPEQVLGDEVDARSDLYGLGVVLFESLAGRPPFDEGNDYATAQARIVGPAPRLSQFRPDLPASLDRLIQRLLDQDPDQRPATAEDLAVQLSSIRIGSEELHAPGAHRVDLTAIDLRADEADEAQPRSAQPTGETTSMPPTFDQTGEIQMPADYGEPDDEPDEDDHEHRSMLPSFSVGALVLLGVVVVAVATAAALFQRFGAEAGANDDGRPGTTLDLSDGDTISLTDINEFGPPVVAIGQAVDPLGDNTENDELAGAALDGDPATAWATETYRKPGFSGVKPGVGYLVSFEDPSVLSRLTIQSPTQGWSAEVYVGNEPLAGPDGWEQGPYSLDEIDGNAEMILEAITGSHLLLWVTWEGQSITELDEGGTELQNRFELAEITVE